MSEPEVTPEETAAEQLAGAVAEVVSAEIEEDDVLAHAAWSINVGCACAAA
jgi:hypothetical protein